MTQNYSYLPDHSLIDRSTCNLSHTAPKNRTKWRNFLKDKTVPSRISSVATKVECAMRSRAIRQRNKANKA